MNIFKLRKEDNSELKSLVIYFSHTGENYMEDGIRNIEKGNIEIVAEYIRELIGAKLFKVETIRAYPYYYHECCDVAKDELNNGARPELTEYLSEIADYDVVYIGSPIWWGHLPMPMFSLLEKLDFEGKTVKFFVTHEGSGLGSIPKDIELLCKGATIKDGLALQGSKVETCKEELEKWLLK